MPCAPYRRTQGVLRYATQIIQPVNGPTASLYGFEVAWQQNLTFLPGVLRSFWRMGRGVAALEAAKRRS